MMRVPGIISFQEHTVARHEAFNCQSKQDRLGHDWMLVDGSGKLKLDGDPLASDL
jgi:hypothetical protein